MANTYSEDVILVKLLSKRYEQDELQGIIDRIRKLRCTGDVTVDFSDVETVGGIMFTQLLELRQLLLKDGHSLALIGVAPATRGVFIIVHLDKVFDFVKDKVAALVHFQQISSVRENNKCTTNRRNFYDD